MDMEIVLNKDMLSKIGLSEIYAYWGDDHYSYEPKRFIYDSQFIFIDSGKCSYGRYLKYLQNIKNQISLHYIKTETSDNFLECFLRELYTCSETFALFIYRNEEEIDEIYYTKTFSELQETIFQSLYGFDSKGKLIIRDPLYRLDEE